MARHGGDLEQKEVKIDKVEYDIPHSVSGLQSILLIVEKNPKLMRYKGIGDWYQPKAGHHLVLALDLEDDDVTLGVLVHELIEQYMCARDGVHEFPVNEFDAKFKGEGEPGDDPAAPYYKQHQAASAVEKVVLEVLGRDFEKCKPIWDAAWEKAFSEGE